MRKDFPRVHYYDQDFVDLYDQTWASINECWHKGTPENGLTTRYFNHSESDVINQFEACLSTFFLVYSNRVHPAHYQLDNFYAKQEESGAIRGRYRVHDGKPVTTKKNPEGILPPLFSWAEYNLFHKSGQKRRIRDIVPVLERYFNWLKATFRDENGLYAVPLEATAMENAPRESVVYPVDFNAQQAISALYLSALAEVLNDKELSFRFKRQYFSLKTRINSKMWNEEDGIYYDLDKNEEHVRVKTVAPFWTLLAEIPNEDRSERLVEHLQDPDKFGLENPFPTVAADEESFDSNGAACRGSVYPSYTFMIIKGLEKYGRYDFARECAIRHLYFMLDALHPEGNKNGTLWEAYAPRKEGPAKWPGHPKFPRPSFVPYAALATITLMIENVVGLYVSLPRKTVDWIIPTLEIMGIENLSLKRNMITILSSKSGRGWEIRLESEKLYYFTINILGTKKKTLPIPSGKCSMLIDKL